MHTCQARSCSKPKSSRAQGCHQHSRLNTGRGDSGSYATLSGDQQVYDQFYERPPDRLTDSSA